MKKHLLYLFLFTIVLSACKKTSEPLLGNVDERLSTTLTAYQTQLVGAKFGWVGYLLTDSKVSATFLFSFTDKNRTTMSADYQPTPSESSYRLKALQRPTLLFDTYSTLHLVADPNPNVFGGNTADGYKSDFEFAFLSTSADTIKLEGTFNKSKLILIRSKSVADNEAAFDASYTMSQTLSNLRTYFKRTTFDGVDYEVKIDVSKSVLSFSYLDGTDLKEVSSNYYVSGTSLILFDPVKLGSTTLTSLNNVNFDTGSNFISATSNGGKTIQIKEAIAPLKYDETGARRFINMPVRGNYNENYTGFTVDGVVDAYGVTTIPGFYSMDYYPNITGQTYGSVRFWLGSAYGAYGPAITPIISSDGKLSYSYAGSYGTPSPSIAQIISNITNNFLKPGGFYVIQTDSKVYDLVAVSDARSWVTFQ